MNVGDKIKAYIDDIGMKQNRLAKLSNMTENALCLSLNGNRKLTVEEYVAICNALGIGYGSFLDDNNRVIKECPPA